MITNNASVVFNRILTPNARRAQGRPVQRFRRNGGVRQEEPGQRPHRHSGPGSVGHFTVEIVNSLAGAELTMIPFKGAGPAVTAALGGHIEGAAAAQGVVAEHLKAGTMRGIIASSKMPEFPQIPTLAQLGYKQNLLGVWSAFFAPAGVPPEVSKTLIAALEKVMKDPTVAARLANLGMVADYEPPEKLIAEIREEHRTVEQIAKKAGLVK